MSRDELIVVVRRQAGQLAVQDRQISDVSGQLAGLMEANEALSAKAGPARAPVVAELGQLLEPALAC
jgi:hypothetical protein